MHEISSTHLAGQNGWISFLTIQLPFSFIAFDPISNTAATLNCKSLVVQQQVRFIFYLFHYKQTVCFYFYFFFREEKNHFLDFFFKNNHFSRNITFISFTLFNVNHVFGLFIDKFQLARSLALTLFIVMTSIVVENVGGRNGFVPFQFMKNSNGDRNMIERKQSVRVNIEIIIEFNRIDFISKSISSNKILTVITSDLNKFLVICNSNVCRLSKI